MYKKIVITVVVFVAACGGEVSVEDRKKAASSQTALVLKLKTEPIKNGPTKNAPIENGPEKTLASKDIHPSQKETTEKEQESPFDPDCADPKLDDTGICVIDESFCGCEEVKENRLPTEELRVLVCEGCRQGLPSLHLMVFRHGEGWRRECPLTFVSSDSYTDEMITEVIRVSRPSVRDLKVVRIDATNTSSAYVPDHNSEGMNELRHRQTATICARIENKGWHCPLSKEVKWGDATPKYPREGAVLRFAKKRHKVTATIKTTADGKAIYKPGNDFDTPATIDLRVPKPVEKKR